MTIDDRQVTVLMSELRSLQAEAVVGTAAEMLREDGALGHHPGDSFGRIVAGAFKRAPAEAYLLIADLLARLRVHDPAAPGPGRRITLDQLLQGVVTAWPGGDEPARDRCLKEARGQVPEYYGSTLSALNTA